LSLMAGLARALSILFLLLFASSMVSAQTFVSIAPKGQADVELYPYEVAVFEIRMINSSEQPINNFYLHVYVDDELAIVEKAGEVKEKTIVVSELIPGREEIREVAIKALQYGPNQLKISLDYGVEKYTHSISTFLSVKKNPVEINARPDKTAISPGEGGAIIFDITNTSANALENVEARLVVPEGIESLTDTFVIRSIEPRQSFLNKEFGFVAESTTTGRKTLVLEVNYDDKKGRHTISREFSIDVQNRAQYLLILVFAIIVLASVSYLLRQRQKPELQTEGLKIHEIKPLPVEEKKAAEKPKDTKK